MTREATTFKARDAVFYHIYPLGFCGAPLHNDYQSPMQERLLKIIDWIPHMQSLGVNALYLGPLFESESHGYDTVSYYHVDRRLGNNDTLKRVVAELHQAGIHVILDGVFNHTSRHFFAFQDIMRRGGESQYRDYYHLDWQGRSPYGDGFTYRCWDGHYNLPNLNLSNPAVKRHLLEAVAYWIEEFDIDGLRLDAADVLDFDFMAELGRASREQRPGFWLMGEVVHGDYRRWTAPGLLDGVTNYECFKGIWSSHNDRNYFEIAYALGRQFTDPGIYCDMELYNFMDNHDVDRFGSLIKKREHIFPSLILLFTMPGVPSLYYGSEWGIQGRKGGPGDKDLRPALELEAMYRDYPDDIRDTISRLAALRSDSPALRYGNFRNVLVQNEYYVYLREYQGRQVLVCLNLRDEPVRVKLEGIEGQWNDLLEPGTTLWAQSGLEVEIPGCWGRVISRKSKV